MKKGLLALVMMFGLVAMTQAQSLMIVNYDQETMINSTAIQDYSSKIEIKNNSAINLDVKVKRQVFSNGCGAFDSTYFCWDFCYTPDVSASVGTMPIAAGATDEFSFSGHVYSNNQMINCTDSIRYTFFVDGNASDSVSVVLLYTSDQNVSIDENSKVVANAFPNPASDRFFIELLDNPSANTIVEVYNLLGSKVKSVDVQSQRTEVNVSDLKSGIYLYTVSKNGQALETQKLVVRH